MSQRTYPHSFDNGAGERITFWRRVPTPRGDRIEGDNVLQPGARVPMHVHHLQTEALTVARGRMGYQCPGGPPRVAGVGESVVFGPGDAHGFWNAGDEELVVEAFIEPADNAEYLLGELFAATKRAGGRRPSLFDVAFLMRRYRSEFTMLEIPRLVQAVLFPAVVALGRLLGRYARYADAPEPVRRPR